MRPTGKPGLYLAILATALGLPTPAFAQARQQATVIMSDDEGARRSQEQWGYSDAVVAGDTIYLSGQVVGQQRPHVGQLQQRRSARARL